MTPADFSRANFMYFHSTFENRGETHITHVHAKSPFILEIGTGIPPTIPPIWRTQVRMAILCFLIHTLVCVRCRFPRPTHRMQTNSDNTCTEDHTQTGRTSVLCFSTAMFSACWLKSQRAWAWLPWFQEFSFTTTQFSASASQVSGFVKKKDLILHQGGSLWPKSRTQSWQTHSDILRLVLVARRAC